jgi:putative ABC transport system substrate-binding protein
MQADLIVQILPAAKTVAIIYNPGETNSQVMVEKMKCSLEKAGLSHACFGIHAENEIAQTVATASRKNDVILVPADNLVVGAMPLISREALKKNRPLIASDIPSVAKGAFMAQGAAYSKLGEQTATMAYKVLLLGDRPQNVGIVNPSDTKVLVNKRVANALGISIPKDIPLITLIDDEGTIK